MNSLGGVLEVDLSKPEDELLCADDRPVSVRDSLVFLEMAIFNTRSSTQSGGNLLSLMRSSSVEGFTPPVSRALQPVRNLTMNNSHRKPGDWLPCFPDKLKHSNQVKG